MFIADSMNTIGEPLYSWRLVPQRRPTFGQHVLYENLKAIPFILLELRANIRNNIDKNVFISLVKNCRQLCQLWAEPIFAN